jgi:exodeoxyribonuclease VII large subunit
MLADMYTGGKKIILASSSPRRRELLSALDDAQSRIVRHTLQRLSTLSTQLTALNASIPLLAERRITAERHRIAIIEEKLKATDPELLLKRGYSINYSNGKIVKDPSMLM